MDEYGYGKNPLDLSKSIAGGGNSCNITINFSKFAIETDTGDSIIKPQSYVSIVGYKPTYGLISLNDVIPFSPSQDIFGNISKFVLDMYILILKKLILIKKLDLLSIKIW